MTDPSASVDPPGPPGPRGAAELERRLGVPAAVGVGLGAMLGAGIFAAPAPAAAAAGSGAALLAGLVVAALIAWANATASVRLAVRYPTSGGAYVFGRERLGPFWGYLAGWSFVTGKTASCAAVALTVGSYLGPGGAHVLAVAAVVLATAVNLRGVQKSAQVTAVIVGVVLVVLLGLVLAAWAVGDPGSGWSPVARSGSGPAGVLEAAGLLFFAFAGYARIATLGEEVRRPHRTLPAAVAVSLGVALVTYAAVIATALAVLGQPALASSTAPLVDVARAVTADLTSDPAAGNGLVAAVRVAAVVAAAGSLLSLLLGVSRTTLAMARDGHLPRTLAVVSPGRATGRAPVPRHAEPAVGATVAVLAAVADLRQAIGFSSFAVLVYYAVANAAAWTLPVTGRGGRLGRVLAGAGLGGCLLVACSLPRASLLAGLAVTGLGALGYRGRRRRG